MAQGEECTLLLENLSLVPSTQPVIQLQGSSAVSGLHGHLHSHAMEPHANTHNLTKSLKEYKCIQSGFS